MIPLYALEAVDGYFEIFRVRDCSRRGEERRGGEEDDEKRRRAADGNLTWPAQRLFAPVMFARIFLIDDPPDELEHLTSPAPRFLYRRYTLAWLHAEGKGWAGLKIKVPPGQVWASPNKSDGYLRTSIPRKLGKTTGDTLPEDF